jgi:hypothetical protein
MTLVVPVEQATRELRILLKKLKPGETITLLEKDGTPRAVLVGVGPAVEPIQAMPEPISAWLAQWDALAQEIGKAWKTGHSALEAVQEMRR